MIASNMVLQVFPKINATRTSCELRKSRNLLVAIPRMRSQMINMTMPTMMSTIRCSLLTAVFVSFKVKASALLSLKALT